MEPREMLDALSVPFPPHAIEQREGGGGRMLSYVATETVIRRLNNAVGVWDFRITEIKVQPAGDSQLLVVWGELTIPGLGVRSGTGVQVIHPRGGEDMWKGAASDALKKCATLFGVGIDLYGPDLEAGELPPMQAPPRSRGTSQNTVPNGHSDKRDGPVEGGKGITYPQMALIQKLADELGMTPEQLRQFAGITSAKDLSKQGASDVITRLKALEADGGAGDDSDEVNPEPPPF